MFLNIDIFVSTSWFGYTWEKAKSLNGSKWLFHVPYTVCCMTPVCRRHSSVSPSGLLLTQTHSWALSCHLKTLEDTARYAGLLLAPAKGFGLWPRLFLTFGQKKRAYYAILAHFWHIWCPVVALVTISSNLSNFERNHKKKKKLSLKIKKI